MSRRPRLNRKSITTLLVVALAYTAFEYATTGAVTWPRDLLSAASDSVTDYAGREEAGWRKAADKVRADMET